MRKIIEIKECMKTFEGDGIPVTRAFPVPGMRENDPFLLFDHFGPINYEPGGATGVPHILIVDLRQLLICLVVT